MFTINCVCSAHGKISSGESLVYGSLTQHNITQLPVAQESIPAQRRAPEPVERLDGSLH